MQFEFLRGGGGVIVVVEEFFLNFQGNCLSQFFLVAPNKGIFIHFIPYHHKTNLFRTLVNSHKELEIYFLKAKVFFVTVLKVFPWDHLMTWLKTAFFGLISSISLIFIGYKADKRNGKMFMYCRSFLERNLFDPHHGWYCKDDLETL